MKTITVVFVGLIAHINQPWSFDNTAVLIMAPEHEAKIVIPAASVPKDGSDQWLKNFTPANGVYTIPISGMSITLDGTRGVFCDHPDEVFQHVPRLRDLTSQCGKLKRAVRRRQPTSKLAAYFDYRGGGLKTQYFLKKKLEYRPAGGSPVKRCAACAVVYEAALDDENVALIFKDFSTGTEHDIVVPGDSEIRVENYPETDTGSHFHMFYELFNDCDDAAHVGPTTEDCEKSNICNPEVIPFPFADCTNSQYP